MIRIFVLRMNSSQATVLKEKYLGEKLRNIRELQVAKHELASSKRGIFQQQPNTFFFLKSSREEQKIRVERDLKKLIEEFKDERIGTSFETEKIEM